MNVNLMSALVLLLLGCEGTPWLQDHTETVLSPGTRIEATNANGTVIVTAGEGTRRTFEGDGWKKTIRMTARSERWFGSLGLYDPGTSAGRATRVMAEEGRIYVDSADDALKYLYVGSTHYQPVYTNSGLVFSHSVAEPWDPETQPRVHDIQIWQIYVKGRRPTTMPGADDEAIRLIGDEPPDTSEPHPAPIGEEMVLGKEPYKPTTRPATQKVE
jgi:hypothetical protein